MVVEWWWFDGGSVLDRACSHFTSIPTGFGVVPWPSLGPWNQFGSKYQGCSSQLCKELLHSCRIIWDCSLRCFHGSCTMKRAAILCIRNVCLGHGDVREYGAKTRKRENAKTGLDYRGTVCAWSYAKTRGRPNGAKTRKRENGENGKNAKTNTRDVRFCGFLVFLFSRRPRFSCFLAMCVDVTVTFRATKRENAKN